MANWNNVTAYCVWHLLQNSGVSGDILWVVLYQKNKTAFQIMYFRVFFWKHFSPFFHAFILLPLVKSDFSDECHPELYFKVSSISEMLQKDEQNVFRSSKLNGLTWRGEWRGRTVRVLVLLFVEISGQFASSLCSQFASSEKLYDKYLLVWKGQYEKLKSIAYSWQNTLFYPHSEVHEKL